MPHGGYHGEVRVGNTVVPQASRPDGKGGQTGGGQYKAEGYKKSNVSNLEKIIRERVATGKVIELFDTQFLYEVHKVVEKGRERIPVDKTSTRLCMFDEKWSKI